MQLHASVSLRRRAAALISCGLLAVGLALVASSQAAAQASDSLEPFARIPSLDLEADSVPLARSTAVWSDGETWYVIYWGNPCCRTKVTAYDFVSGERRPGRDITLVYDSGVWSRMNIFPRGLWSDGSTLYVADEYTFRVFAYSLEAGSYGAHLHNPSFDLQRTWEGMEDYADMWSDGETMWIANYSEPEIQGYDLATGQRDRTKDFTTLAAAGNDAPFGIWSDGETMWVSDKDDKRIYAYDMLTQQRQSDLEFDTLDAAGNDEPAGLWSDGHTMWVADNDWDNDRVYAYAMPPRPHLESLEVSDVELEQRGRYSFGGRVPRGVDTVTVTPTPTVDSSGISYSVDDSDDVDEDFQWDLALGENTLEVTVTVGTRSNVYTTTVLKVDVDELSDDASLSSLTVDGESVEGLSADVTDYRMRVANSVESVTVAAVPTVAQAQVTFTPEDADAAEGYQVALAEGLNPVEVEVTATDGTVVVYTLVVSREPSVFGRDEFFDLVGLGPHHSVDVWGDSSTWWVAYDRRGNRAVDEVLAYDAATGGRDPDKDIDTLGAAGNTSPQALWSNGGEMWVLDGWQSKVFRYSLADADYGARVETGARLEGIGEDRARGLWSDGATTWVADSGAERVYAYDSATGARVSSQDFNTLTKAGNEVPYDLWSDGVVMWVLDKQDKRIYAYDMLSKQRLEDLEFSALDRANDWPSGIWSDGTTMWVSDYDDHRVYAYRMPEVPGLRLKTLAVSGVELTAEGLHSFEGRVPRTVDTVTVTAVAVDGTHQVTFSVDDSDDVEGGFQWDLALGDNPLEVTVSDGTDSLVYTLGVRKVDADELPDELPPFARSPSLDLADVRFGYRHSRSTDAWSDGQTWYVNYWGFPGGRTKVLAYDFATGRRLSRRDVNLIKLSHNENHDAGYGWRHIFPWGLWSDGSTLYVNDDYKQRVFAYSLEEDSYGDYLYDSSFYLRAAASESYAGMWSDGDTLWIAKRVESKIEGYDLATGQWDSTKDFTTLSAEGNHRPLGVWSDGTTMWVSDKYDRRIYAYDMATKQRQSDLEFDTLDPANDRPAGLWSDGHTMWVSDNDDDRVYAYVMPPGRLHLESLEASDIELQRLSLASFEGRAPRTVDTVTVTPTAMDDTLVVTYSVDDADDVEKGFQWDLALGENTLTVTVSDGTRSREHTVTVLKVDVDELSDDASLSSLTVGGVSVEGLSADVTDYRLRVGNDAALVTVTAVPTVAKAQVTFTPEDADAAEGYQVALAEGLDTVAIEVEATDGTVVVYTLVIGGEPSVFGRDELLDFAVLGPHHSVDVWRDGPTWWVAYDRRGSGGVDEVLAYDAVTGERVPDKDVTSLNGVDVGNTSPQALWSDGGEMWVLDGWKSKVFRYSLADANYGAHFVTGARLEGIGEDRARGLWSDGATVWVIDTGEDRVYAYDSATGARVASEDFDTLAAAGNTEPYDLWSDGVVMWVLDKQDQRIYAYDMLSKQRLEGLEFAALDPDNDWPSGIWSDGTTMWVSDYDDHRAYAYRMPEPVRLESLAVSGVELTARDPHSFEGRVPRTVDTVTVTPTPTDDTFVVTYSVDDSDDNEKELQWDLALGENTLEVTVTVADGTDSTVYTVTVLKVDVDELSDDASLSSLTVDGESVEGFTADGTDYRLRVGKEVASVTVAAVPTVAQAQVTFTPADADAAEGYQVSLVEGLNTVTIEVVATDGTVVVYTLVVSRPPGAFARFPSLDLENLDDGLAGSYSTDVWSDGETWYVNYWGFPGGRTKILAYDFATGRRLPGRDINLINVDGDSTRRSLFPWGLWSDGSTLYVSDEHRKRVFAYSLEDGSYGAYLHDSSFYLSGAIARSYAGMWSDGVTLWVAKRIGAVIEGYDLATGQRDSSKDFTTLAAAGNHKPFGIWSDGNTMWVSDEDDKRIYAYDMATKQRQSDLEFAALDPGNDEPAGIWSDGDTMWVSDRDYDDDRAYAYLMPDTVRLKTLAASDVELTRRGLYSFEGRVPRTVASATVTAVAVDGSHPVAYSVDDADAVEGGFQWDLALGENTLTVTVTDGIHSREYTVRVLKVDVDVLSDDASLASLSLSGVDFGLFDGATLGYASTVAAGTASTTVTAVASDEGAAVTIVPGDADSAEGYQVGLVEGVTVVRVVVESSDGSASRVYSVEVTRPSVAVYGWGVFADIDSLPPSNGYARGVWSDGTTMWVSDIGDDRLYAYDLDTMARAAGRDLTGLGAAGNHNANGVWSDCSTMWVSDDYDDKIYAYRLDSGGRDRGREFDTLSGAGNRDPKGMWSNATTMWVADNGDDKIYAYHLDSGRRKSGSDIDGLRAAGNRNPRGIWSDGVTMWVSDATSDKIYAYRLDSGERDSAKDFDALVAAGNLSPVGIWSNGVTMWVSDNGTDKIYSYNMPLVAGVRALDLSGIAIDFSGETLSYSAQVGHDVESTTVTAVPVVACADVDVSPDDADSGAGGHQVALAVGDTAITVTATVGSLSTVYTATVTRAPAAAIPTDRAGSG